MRLEVKLPCKLSCLLVVWSATTIGWLDGRPACNDFEKGGKLHSHAPIGALYYPNASPMIFLDALFTKQPR